MKHIIYCFLLTIVIQESVVCQLKIDPNYLTGEKVRKIPSIEYEAGWLHKVFFGKHWRDVWIQPEDIDVLELSKFAGGLTPFKRGGGMQTENLRLKGNDGNEYKFRSIDKNPYLKKTRLENVRRGIVKDQVSVAHPFAPLVVSTLLYTIGVLNSAPVPFVMPDDPSLGEFRNDFGNMLGFMEIDPKAKNIPGSDKVINSDKLLKRLDNEQNEFVDAKDFLKARLIDILVNDWDRPRDQWNWARLSELPTAESFENRTIYKPIPRDRDQAFAKFDGIIPSLVISAAPQVNSFNETFPSMKKLTWSGRYLDQRFLVFMDRYKWDSISGYVFAKLTDDVLENAVKQLPKNAYKISANELLWKLKLRRSALMKASSEFYELVNLVADIFGTNKNEDVHISGLPNQTTEISVYRSADRSMPLYHKIFQNYLTSEIRIYLQAGDDKVIVKGVDVNSPTIRIIGGEGNDELSDNSDLPVKFYDSGTQTKIIWGENTSYDDENYAEPWDSLQAYYNRTKSSFSDDKKDEFEEQINNIKYDVNRKDRFHSFSFAPYLSTNPDYGVLFGGSVTLNKYGFRSQPNLYNMQLKVAYAPTKRNASGLQIDYKVLFRKAIKGVNTVFHTRYSGVEINHFFGFGNQSSYDDALFKSGYYNAFNEEVLINPYIEFPQDPSYAFSVGAVVDYFHVNENQNSLLLGVPPYGVKNKLLLGVHGGLLVDNRDNETAPYKGFYFNANGYYYPKAGENRHSFGKVFADIRAYLYSNIFTDISLALRARGERIWGIYPFYKAAYIGGSRSLRGFSTERFAGDASLLGSAELRFKLFKVNVILPAAFGILIFGESGRVFLDGENSDLWHTGYGAGLYAYVVDRNLTFNLTFARSKEKTSAVYFYSGFAF